MAVFDGVSTGLQTGVYFQLDEGLPTAVETVFTALNSATPPTQTQLDAAYTATVGTGKIVIAANKLPLTTDVGDVGQEPAKGSFGVYDEDTARQFATQSEPSEFQLEVALDMAQAAHRDLRAAKNGRDILIAIYVHEGSGANLKDYVDVLECQIAGPKVSTPLNDVRRFQLNLSVGRTVPGIWKA